MSAKTSGQKGQAGRPNIDGVVRRTFGLIFPRLIKYQYGFSELDTELGECRDEQAWILQLEYATSPEEPANLQLATIWLRPGVSKREARKALDLAFRAFPFKHKGQRPSLRRQEHELLKKLFEVCQHILGTRGKRKLVIDIGHLALLEAGYNRSRSTVAKALRQFLISRHLSVKRYVTARTDIYR